MSYAAAAVDQLIYVQLNDAFHHQEYDDDEQVEYYSMKSLVLDSLGYDFDGIKEHFDAVAENHDNIINNFQYTSRSTHQSYFF